MVYLEHLAVGRDKGRQGTETRVSDGAGELMGAAARLRSVRMG